MWYVVFFCSGIILWYKTGIIRLRMTHIATLIETRRSGKNTPHPARIYERPRNHNPEVVQEAHLNIEPQNRRTAEPQNRRTAEPQNRRTAEPHNIEWWKECPKSEKI
jgi:hypothetical protein